MKIELTKRELILIRAIQEIPNDCFIKDNTLEIEDSKKLRVSAIVDTLKGLNYDE